MFFLFWGLDSCNQSQSAAVGCLQFGRAADHSKSMSHCVPDWDLGSGTLDGIIPGSEFVPMVKGKWESVQQKKSNCSELPFVPDHEFAELLWENGQIVMQGQISRNSKRPLSANLSSHLSRSEQSGDAVLPAKPGKDGTLESVVHDIRAVAGAPNAGFSHDDEMASLLHYPLDDSFEREYCSGLFGDMSNANIQPLGGQLSGISPQRSIENGQVAKESSVQESSAGRSTASKQINADAAMALGAGRASGAIPQAGVQPFAKVRTVSESLASKWYSNTATASNSRHVNLAPNVSQSPYKAATQVPASSLDMPPPRIQQIDPISVKPTQSGKPGLTNFSHFSRPAALMKANLQSIGISAGLSTVERLKKLEKVFVSGNASVEPSKVESTTSGRSIVGSNNGGSSHVQVPGQQPGLGSQSNCQAFEKNSLLRDDSGNATCLDDIMDSSPKAPEQAMCQSYSVTGSMGLGGIEKGVDAGKAPEPTVTCSSGGSGNSAGRTGKETTNGCKRKGRDVEESECQSEDGEGESVDVKKQAPSRPTTAKRSRAAEVHNQSERRRRDRINEKMRALQELIPNCNKSDKASMLDEAIEYLKTLQLQVQIMSMGGGMCISPMMLPASMQHLQMPQMAHFSPMGMGMGMGFGMGFGMGVLDMGTASGRPVMPLPSMHGLALPGSSIPGPAGMPMTGMPGAGLPMSGIPGPGLTISGLPGPALPVSGVPAKALSGTARPGLVSASAPNSSNSQDHVQNTTLMNSYKVGLGHHPLQAPHQAMDGNTSSTVRVQTQQHPAQMSGSGTSNAAIGTGSACNGTPD